MAASWITQAQWTLARDILLTLGGLTLIMWEVFGAGPPVDDTVIITGLAMTGIGASFHLGTVAGGFIGRSSSSSSPPPPGLSDGSR